MTAPETPVVLTDAMIEAAARVLCMEWRVTARDGEQYAPFDDCTEAGRNVWRSLARPVLTAALAAQPTPPAPAADAVREALVREADALRSLLKRAKKWVRDDTLYDDINNELLYKRDGLDAARRAADAGGV